MHIDASVKHSHAPKITFAVDFLTGVHDGASLCIMLLEGASQGTFGWATLSGMPPDTLQLTTAQRAAIARKVTKARLALGLTKRGAIKESGITYNTWDRAEKGEPVTAVTLTAIERRLEMPPGSLINQEAPPADETNLAAGGAKSAEQSDLGQALMLLQSVRRRMSLRGDPWADRLAPATKLFMECIEDYGNP